MPAAPKRILSLDGGGIRGVFSLMVLAEIEALFRTERGRPDLVLRDEFDFFAGTSTGAIIATALAWGYSTTDILDLYEQRGREMFAKAAFLEGLLHNKYEAGAIADFFRDRFCEDDGTPALLGTGKLWGATPREQRDLLVVMRNASTGSPWPVCNNPRAKYNDRARANCNLQLPLWQLLRASTAAPTYFPPEEISLGGRTQLFVDGGITPYNNPALLAVLMATLPAYRIGYPTGRDRLLVVSVGTGGMRTKLAKPLARQVHKLDFLQFVAPALIGTVAAEQDLLCRVLGDCLHGAELDRELGDLHGPGLLADAEKKFSYVRYNQEFPEEEIADLTRRTGEKFSLDNLALIPFLKKAGRAYAKTHVRREHLFPPGAALES